MPWPEFVGGILWLGLTNRDPGEQKHIITGRLVDWTTRDGGGAGQAADAVRSVLDEFLPGRYLSSVLSSAPRKQLNARLRGGMALERPTVGKVTGHFRRVAEADLSYPVILGPGNRVMDGMHRVARALPESRTTIRARRFRELPEPGYRGRRPGALPC